MFILEWFMDTFNNDPLRFIIEVIMGILIVRLLTKKSYRQPSIEEKLTKQEEEEIIRDWVPKPLVQTVETNPEEEFRLVLQGKALPHCIVNGENCINMLTCGVLGLQASSEVIEHAVQTVKKYGIGSCGPRGFYGSLKPHVDFEEAIAKFLGFEGGVMYSSEFQAIATIIPAFLKSGDTLIVDKGVSFAFYNGIGLGKCTIIWLDHNNVNHLRTILTELRPTFKLMKKRVYLAIEGIYANTGDIAPLPEYMKLKNEFPFRILLEESYSMGVLGKTGRGITEHFGINPKDIEIIVGSLGNALGGTGAYVVGDKNTCSHQRLNCTGYVFSCALPPFTSAASEKVLQILDQDNGQIISRLHQNINLVHSLLNSIDALINVSSKESPYIHLRLKNSRGNREDDRKVLINIVDLCRKSNVIFGNSSYSNREKVIPEPSIKISVPVDLDEDEIRKSISVLKSVVEAIII